MAHAFSPLVRVVLPSQKESTPSNQKFSRQLSSNSDKDVLSLPHPFSVPSDVQLPNWQQDRRYLGRSRLPDRRHTPRLALWSLSSSDVQPVCPKCPPEIASADRSPPCRRPPAAHQRSCQNRVSWPQLLRALEMPWLRARRAQCGLC